MDIGDSIQFLSRAPLGKVRFPKVVRERADRAVHDHLRRSIVAGQLAAGDWLRQEELAGMFGLSRMPIRDAFRALESEGLVEFVPRRGVRVAPLTLEELEELYAARLGLEGLAARRAAAAMTSSVLREMRARLARLQKLSQSKDLEAFLDCEADYHRVCYSASGRERLCRKVADLRERARRYLQVVFDRPGALDSSVDFQRQLLAACEARDGDLAERVMQDALQWTMRHVTDLLAQPGRSERATA